MYQRVIDIATGKEEMIDFIPVNTYATASRIPDALFAHMHDYVDHTRAAYPEQDWTPPPTYFEQIQSDFNLAPESLIKSKDISYRAEKSGTPCDLFLSIKRHGGFTRHMMRAYADFESMNQKQTEIDSLHELELAHSRLTKHGYSYAMSDDQITEFGKEKSYQFAKRVFALRGAGEAEQFREACDCLHSLGLGFNPSVIEKTEENGELYALTNRAIDEKWLIRQLRRKCAYELERVARDLSLVQRHKQIYCSDYSVLRHRDRIKSNQTALEKTVAYDEQNPDCWFTMSELSGKSVSNPAIRRAEMFTRLKGFEQIAQESKHSAMFYTLTSPSRFHCSSNGAVNPKWLEAGRPTVQHTHDYLMKVWQDMRKWMDKNEIKVYGMRIVEPHQDGTPHHHFLLFMEKHHAKLVTKEFKRLALVDSPNEKGAKKRRFTSETIDFNRGSAVGYVAKYLSKNVDGQHIETDRNSNLSGIEAAERVVTWARVNQIRQFQFIGGPSVTVWRELRRLREEFKEDDAMFTDLSQEEHFLLEKVRRSADEGDWKAFCYAMGGVLVKRKDQTVKSSYSAVNTVEKLIDSHGEFVATRYGDAAQARLNGLIFRDVFITTRFKTWKTANKEQFIRAQQQIMDGVVDWFDVLEREREYERMQEENYQQYERLCAEHEELQMLMLYAEPLEIDAMCWVGAAPPDTWH
ncbi:replication endonuclease [Vibrio vulnificus]|nr:replication endonuclease [Vibrio vulnificus]EJC6820853.1 replication endonuclease [Vibrio vulnificus]EJC6954674.1 replication endonuclease [Vibrio vulnificus]EJC6959167.1 replication endonuclease [Vibrio vulnificus]EKQ3695567.1 replication endonuclease [Vibrio vulnificus]